MDNTLLAATNNLLDTPLVTVNNKESVSRAAILMNKHNVHHLPVIHDDGTLAGLCTVDNLISYLALPNPILKAHPIQKVS